MCVTDAGGIRDSAREEASAHANEPRQPQRPFFYLGQVQVGRVDGTTTEKVKEKILVRKHPDTLTSLTNLTSVHQRQDKYEVAEAMHFRILEQYDKDGPDR